MSISFVVASVLITLLPGPSMLVVMMNALQKGGFAAVVTALGVVVADALLLILTLSGIGALLYTSSLAFSLVKWLGIVYLIYLGLRQLLSSSKSNRPVIATNNETDRYSLFRSFMQGLVTTMLNPKIIGFFIAFFPQFLDSTKTVVPQLLVMGPVFLLIVLVILLFYVVLASSAKSLLDSERGQRLLQKLSAGLLVGCGIVAMSMER